MPSKTSAGPTTRAIGEICAGSVYTLFEFSRRSGLGRWAIRQLRREGLRIRRIRGRSFVVGADFVQFLAQQTGGDE